MSAPSWTDSSDSSYDHSLTALKTTWHLGGQWSQVRNGVHILQLQYYFQYNTGSAQGLVKPVQYSLKLLMLASSQIMSTVHGVQICNPHSCTVKLWVTEEILPVPIYNCMLERWLNLPNCPWGYFQYLQTKQRPLWLWSETSAEVPKKLLGLATVNLHEPQY